MSRKEDPISQFHPAVARWFTTTFQQPTAPQQRGWPAILSGEHTLIAAPTGSGKTLAAFLASLDRLFKEQLDGRLGRETRVLYISPLKALSKDIHRNLSLPLEGIGRVLEEMDYGRGVVTAAVRTGDTTAAERRKIVREPPHILVTTPESFYLLLTSISGRGILETVDTLILDEIHALADNRRGAHLSLSIERLEALTRGPLQRIGLSATQSPMSLVAHILVGGRNLDPDGSPRCRIIDEGHLKAFDLAVELPDSPLEAVMSNEVWEEVYRRLLSLIEQHRTTLIFVNTRRLAERITFRLEQTLGEQRVASHHGSLAPKIRHAAEKRLKSGQLRALVATASLELGIDIGSVDLVCQIGSPRSISTLVQRIGRSGHYLGGTPKGRLFPLSRDELIECVALLRSVRAGQLDQLVVRECPLDVLAQQIVAAAAGEEWEEEALLALFRNAWLYRNLDGATFRGLVHMLADGITTKRGRRGALIYFDGVNRRIKGRKGARLTALTNGGAIPDNADYRVLLEPSGAFVGTVNEDFAVESLPGNVFRLGSNSWRILKLENGIMRVEDAHGQPPTIPFWFGEAPARADELSRAVSELREDVLQRLDDPEALNRFLYRELGLAEACASQLTAYLDAAKKALGTLPTRTNLVMERFFDEAGGQQLVIHAPLGSRVNRAWGLALRKRFCRSFNFELQAAATEDAIVLSLGPKHSFPLDEVFRFLHAKTARDLLVQALLDAPMFQTRWRWTAGRSLALVRQRGGRRIPPNVQRMEAEDLIAVVFPDQSACLENIAGDREIPDHPLVRETIEDCLVEAMDVDAFLDLLSGLEEGSIRCRALDLPEPSPLAHEVLNAQPYAFLDNAPLEERRTRAVYLRRTLDPETIRDQGLLDMAAVETVRAQAWPSPEDSDEVHEALLQLGALPVEESQEPYAVWQEGLEKLMADGRAGVLNLTREERAKALYIAAETLPRWRAIQPNAPMTPDLVPPDRDRLQDWDPESARLDLLRGFLEVAGPTTSGQLARWFFFTEAEVEMALLALEAEGTILRGYFDERLEDRQWCHRALLARIHHLTLARLRTRIKPVTAQQFMRFLFQWQHVHPEYQVRESEGLAMVLEQLEGFEAAAGSWELDLLPARVKGYSRTWLDQLCLLGRVSWARIGFPRGHRGSSPLKTTPISIFLRANADIWCRERELPPLSTPAGEILEVLEQRGALFFAELMERTGLLHTQLEMVLGELVGLGLVNSDSFAGLRALLLPANRRPSPQRRSRIRRMGSHGIEYAGRWSLVPKSPPFGSDDPDGAEHMEYRAMVLLRRYGVVFRRLLDREAQSPSWRDLLAVYRRLEAIGEIRGGRFVEGYSGEQFALPEALSSLRAQRDREHDGLMINLCGTDPLNLTGALLPGPTIGQTPGNRILFRDGLPFAALDGGKLMTWEHQDAESEGDLERLLKRHPHAPRPFDR